MKKLLVWDGDDTLWDGTIVEDGLDGISLPQGRAEFCRELRSRGVVQSIASRNLLSDVVAALHKFGLSDCFLYPQADWDTPKSEMVHTIVRNLGLSKYSDVVFLDDDIHHVEEVESALEGIVAHVMPEERAEELLAVTYFTKGSYTDEDRARVDMYAAEKLRNESGLAYDGDRLDFLRSCKMRMGLFSPRQQDMPRIIDMVTRANRLSAVVEKPSVLDLELWRSNGQLFAIKADDRYGGYGISGVACLHNEIIRLLVISCRLQGKGYGSALLGSIINRIVGTGLGRPTAIWKETEYNAGMRSLYEWYRFDFEQYGDIVVARMRTDQQVELPDWIEVERL